MQELVEVTADPYVTTEMTAAQLGLPLDVIPADAILNVRRFERPVDNLEAAAAIYNRHGAVILTGDTNVPIDGSERMLSEAVEPVRQLVLNRLAKNWKRFLKQKIVRRKKYTAYNGTPRLMTTVAWDNVKKVFPEVIDLQEQLLPMVRAINGDESTELSVDPDEGTVINIQTFNSDGNPEDAQEHGAHNDRVDTTVVVCLQNVGEHGDLVFIQGYTAACQKFGLDPHRYFNENLRHILAEGPEQVEFRVHPVRPGSLVLVKTALDVHFITPKKVLDVQAGMDDLDPADIRLEGNEVLGRGIINMAYETGEGRAIDALSLELERRAKISGLRGDAFFERAHAVLDESGLDPDMKQRVMAAMVTRLSAEDLYGSSLSRFDSFKSRGKELLNSKGLRRAAFVGAVAVGVAASSSLIKRSRSRHANTKDFSSAK